MEIVVRKNKRNKGNNQSNQSASLNCQRRATMVNKPTIEQNCNDARLKLCKTVHYLHSVIDNQVKRIKSLEELLREHKKDDVQRIEVPNDLILKGAKLVECYETEEEIIVIGEPKDNDENHNCDFMGCSSTSHVLYRFSKVVIL